MVDVAFLLLIFFMLTTQFKPPEKKEIKLPESHSELKVPQSKLILLSIAEDGGMLMQFPKYMVDASGKPIMDQEGHPRITTMNVEESLATLEHDLGNARLEFGDSRMVVKTDRRVDYGVMQDVMAILQNTNTTTFNVVTELSKDSP